MTDTTPTARFREAYRLFLAGRPQDALACLPETDGLDDDQSSTWWRLRGMLHQHAGDYAQAAAAYRRAAATVPPSSLRFGEARFAAAVLFGLQGRREEAVSAYLDAQSRLRAHRRHAHLAVVNYNLGWSLAQLMRLDLATETLERDLLSTERGEARQHAGLLHYGRAYVWTLRGEYARAMGSAAWAAEAEDSVDVRLRIRNLQAQLTWLQDGRSAALSTVRALQSGDGRETSRLTRESLSLTADILAGNEAALEVACRQDEHSVRVRAGLHRAALALTAGDVRTASDRLGAVMTARPTPAQLQFEAPFLADLYAWARAWGYPFPAPPQGPDSTVRVRTTGSPALSVSGHQVWLALSPEAAAVAAYLAETGATGQEVLSHHVLGHSGKRGRAALARALNRLRLCFGTRECVRSEGGVVRLDDRWDWTVDQDSGPCAFGGLDSDYAREVELRQSGG